jgi:hypothetical protein
LTVSVCCSTASSTSFDNRPRFKREDAAAAAAPAFLRMARNDSATGQGGVLRAGKPFHFGPERPTTNGSLTHCASKQHRGVMARPGPAQGELPRARVRKGAGPPPEEPTSRRGDDAGGRVGQGSDWRPGRLRRISMGPRRGGSGVSSVNRGAGTTRQSAWSGFVSNRWRRFRPASGGAKSRPSHFEVGGGEEGRSTLVPAAGGRGTLWVMSCTTWKARLSTQGVLKTKMRRGSCSSRSRAATPTRKPIRIEEHSRLVHVSQAQCDQSRLPMKFAGVCRSAESETSW